MQPSWQTDGVVMVLRQHRRIETMTNNPLLFGGQADVPSDVASCPECGGRLHVRSMAWGDQTGVPLASELQIDCVREVNLSHRWFQSDWQPVVDQVRKWAGAVNEAELRD